jgi:hypothetical protein
MASAPNIGLSATAAKVAAVASSANGDRSRRLSRPAVWSISAPVSTTAPIGLPRVARGCSASLAAIWARKSGEALSKVQRRRSGDTARLAWLRGRTRASPAQASRQTSQLQFHCG